MQQKSMIIIGAGIAGLSAGCYGQMNGYHAGEDSINLMMLSPSHCHRSETVF